MTHSEVMGRRKEVELRDKRQLDLDPGFPASEQASKYLTCSSSQISSSVLITSVWDHCTRITCTENMAGAQYMNMSALSLFKLGL